MMKFRQISKFAAELPSWIFFCTFVLMHFGPLHAKMRHKLSSLRISAATGYDSNIYRIAEQGIVNRIGSQTGALHGRISMWQYWNKKIRTFISGSGNYSHYVRNSSANEYRLSLRTKTSFFLHKNSRATISALRLDLSNALVVSDQLYVSRTLGEEHYQDLGDDGAGRLYLGDLFDKTALRGGAAIKMDLRKQWSFTLGYTYEKNNYTDIADPLATVTNSLDNTEHNLNANVTYQPNKRLSLRLKYEGQDRRYKFRQARNLQGDLLDSFRKYWTNKTTLTLAYKRKDLNIKTDVAGRWRTDKTAGYYNNRYIEAQFEIANRISPFSFIEFGAESAWKNYENLTFSGQLMSTRYLTLTAGLRFAISRQIQLRPLFVHDQAKSVLSTFTYKRNSLVATLEYNIR